MAVFSNDHYVPQFLLRNFADSGKVHVFDLKSQKYFRTNPKNIMSEKGFTSVKLKDGCWIEFEDKFTYIENSAKPIIKRIIDHGSIGHLKEMDHAMILTFLVVQHLRSRATRNVYLSIPAEIRRRFPDINANDYPQYFEDNEYDKFAFLKSTMDDLSKYVAPLIHKPMILMKRSGNEPIYISDNPFIMYNQRNYGPYGNIGLAVPGVEIYLPIHPDYVISILCPSSLSETRNYIRDAKASLTKISVQSLRTGTAFTRSAMKQTESVRSAIAQAEENLDMMEREHFAVLTPENIWYLNSLQIQYSNRYIVAVSEKFDFAKKALSEHPEWTEPPKLSF